MATHAPQTLSTLPDDDGTLFVIWHKGAQWGIGTADEVRGLAAEGLLPVGVVMAEVGIDPAGYALSELLAGVKDCETPGELALYAAESLELSETLTPAELAEYACAARVQHFLLIAAKLTDAVEPTFAMSAAPSAPPFRSFGSVAAGVVRATASRMQSRLVAA